MTESAAPQILVVDDTEANLLAVRSTLEELDLDIVEARSGREALRLLLERDFALILLDVQMPGIDGFETARLIRSRVRSRSTPIIFVTAFGRKDDKVLEGYGLGAVDFLFKPIVPEVLRAKTSVFVELHRRTLEAEKQAVLIRDLERSASRRRLAAEKQRWEAERLREENRNKDEFLAMLAHELRNPLSPIRTGLAILESGELTPERHAMVLASMNRQLRHLVRLVDDLLDVARISQGKISLRREPLELAALIAQAVEAQRPNLESRKHTWSVDCPEGVRILADDVRLSQIVQNLVSNASRYTPEGGRVRVEAEETADDVRIRVIDNGRGIAPELLNDVFGLFVQERNGGSGLGLGLSLVKSLVALHEGTVAAYSEGRGLGATFEVVLPRLESPHDPTEEAEEPAQPVPSESLRVAVIDDNRDVLEATATLLELRGHQVLRASRGDQGLELVKRETPDVVFIDISMPGMTGDQVARAICEQMGDTRPRLVALTGHGDPDTHLAGAGFDHHLMKPAEPDALERALWRTDGADLDP